MIGIRTVTVRTKRAGALKISASLPGEISLFLRIFIVDRDILAACPE
jgi:hypothetical protein